MIVDQNGRAASTRTAEEDEEFLQKELENLTPEERKVLEMMLADMGSGDHSLIDMIREAEYETPPVDIHTFVKDEYFLGNTCDALYDQHLADLIELFESGDYQEAIWTGSIGYGKTFVASVAVARILYEISCLKDPHRSFGLASDSNISVVCLSVNETLAMKVAFENIATKLKASPYFQEHFPFKETKKEFRFPHNVWLAARATTDTSVLGLNVISGLLDETNFMQKGKQDARFGALDHAETLYAGMKRRMKSRFERKGRLPGKLFLVSSKKTSDDFTARRIRESRNDPTVFVRDYALWDVKPGSLYSDKTFEVVCGNDQIPSRILDAGEAHKIKSSLPDGVTLIDVPEDFRVDFENDLEGSIRDIAGVATVAISPFIQRREKLIWTPKHKHPFSVEVYDPSKPGVFLWDRMVQPTMEKDFSGSVHETLRPIINPQAPRHVHIDPAYRKDAVGVCMAHIFDWRDVVRRTDDGEVYQERAPVFFVDFILQVVPPIGDEIVLGDLRRLVYELSKHGYMVTYVTMDTWQSVDSLQHLKRKGYRAEHLSVDTKTDPYEGLKSAFYEDRVILYDYPPVFKELRQLEHDAVKKKIDHPPKGSKDVADALAGVTFTLTQRQSSMPLPMMPGLSYHPDVWMEEHVQASMANQGGGAPDQRYFPSVSAMGGRAPMPFLTGNMGGDDGDWGGGWNPSSL